VSLQRLESAVKTVELTIGYHGCDAAGLCYMPEHKTLKLNLPEITDGERVSANPVLNEPEYTSEQDEILFILNNKSQGFVLMSFFGFGLLLAFTPCVFPMLPIISGIVAGQGTRITSSKAFWLSLCYVLASALTYAILGVFAGIFGSNIQALLQNPWVIAAFSGLFVLLALSMFGLFELQMPTFIQSRLISASVKQRGGHFWGAGIMGVFSALIIGPCVTAPLAGALLYIGQTGDAVFGGAALFSLGLGMGLPLLAVGTFAGKLMPKAGAWMDTIKILFGLGLLAVAIWLLSRILPPTVILGLWVLLAVIPVFLFFKKRQWRLASSTLAAYGLMLWLGFSGQFSKEIPSMVCSAVEACEATLKPTLNFTRISNVKELQTQLELAKQLNKPVILDFYADWCAACVDMKYGTFTEPLIHQALSNTVLLQADVTQNTDEDKALLNKYQLIGPPAILLFNQVQKELLNYRIIGFIDKDDFLVRYQKAYSPSPDI
jgi:thioredoxin:protein disulfide reductase